MSGAGQRQSPEEKYYHPAAFAELYPDPFLPTENHQVGKASDELDDFLGLQDNDNISFPDFINSHDIVLNSEPDHLHTDTESRLDLLLPIPIAYGDNEFLPAWDNPDDLVPSFNQGYQPRGFQTPTGYHNIPSDSMLDVVKQGHVYTTNAPALPGADIGHDFPSGSYLPQETKYNPRSDPRYDAKPDKDGFYTCPYVAAENCHHKPTRHKAVYAKNLDSHLKPYLCRYRAVNEDCRSLRFSSNATLFRHEREVHDLHNHGTNPYLCYVAGCERARPDNGFPRRWNQFDHMKRVHGWNEPLTDSANLSARRRSKTPASIPVEGISSSSSSSYIQAPHSSYPRSDPRYTRRDGIYSRQDSRLDPREPQQVSDHTLTPSAPVLSRHRSRSRVENLLMNSVEIMRREQPVNRVSLGNSATQSSFEASKVSDEKCADRSIDDGLISPTKSISSWDVSNLTREEGEERHRTARDRNLAECDESTVAQQPCMFDEDSSQQRTTFDISPELGLAFPDDEQLDSDVGRVSELKDDKLQSERRDSVWKSKLEASESYPVISKLGPATDSGYASLDRGCLVKTKENLQIDTPDDESSIYSDQASIETSVRMELVEKFAESLHKALGELNVNANYNAIIPALVELLGDFAIRLGQENPSAKSQVAMVFVHKYRHSITCAFEQISTDLADEETHRKSSKVDDMSLQERMQRWSMEDAEPPLEDHIEQAENSLDTLPSDEPEDYSILKEYENLVCNTSSYDWLLKSIQKHFLLMPMDDHVNSNIRAAILKHIPSFKRITRIASAKFQNAIFDLHLDSLLYSPEKYNGPLSSYLTVTGQSTDAQALKCGDYIRQTWPVMGMALLQLLDDSRSLHLAESTTCTRPDGTIMTAKRHTSGTEIMVSGSRSIIVEVAEQIAWLQAALNPAQLEGIVYCSPEVLCISREDQIARFCVKLDYSEPELKSTRGTCWHELFQRCIVVRGFPVRRKPEADSGIEIPFRMMMSILGTDAVQQFNHNIYVKGFSAILAPAKWADGTIVWHLACKRDNNRISYIDHSVQEGPVLRVDQLMTARHVIGWCSAITNYCGFPVGGVSPGTSSFTTSPSFGYLRSFDLSFGPQIARANNFKLTPNHEPRSVFQTPYLDILRFLESQFVLLWDSRDHRGWLVNGLRALLHLLRYSLNIDKEEYGDTLFVLTKNALEEPSNPYNENAARTFLSNPKNLATRICVSDINDTGQEFELLGDRVKRLFCVLEKAFDYQKTCNDWTKVSRSKLDGWDFVAIARKDQKILPSTCNLPTVANSWVDFTRAIGAITLFGEGFGEVLKPQNTKCISMPCNKFLLAITVSDIQRLMNATRCDPSRSPRLIARGPLMIWYTPTGSAKTCYCETLDQNPPTQSSVQVLWLHEFQNLLEQSGEIFDLQNHAHGAVLFGHNPTMRHYVADLGSPLEGSPPDPLSELEVFSDSGVGSSLKVSPELSRFTSSSSDPSFDAPAAPLQSMQTYGNSVMNGGHCVQGNVSTNISVYQCCSSMCGRTHEQSSTTPVLSSTSENSPMLPTLQSQPTDPVNVWSMMHPQSEPLSRKRKADKDSENTAETLEERFRRGAQQKGEIESHLTAFDHGIAPGKRPRIQALLSKFFKPSVPKRMNPSDDTEVD